MTGDEAAEIAGEIEKMCTAVEIKRHLDSVGVCSKPDVATILRVAVNRQPSLSVVVEDCLLDCMSDTEEFHSLVLDVYRNTHNDRRPNLISKMYTESPKTVIWLAQKLKNPDEKAPSIFPHIMSSVYRGDETDLVNLLGAIDRENKEQAIQTCQILKEYINYKPSNADYSTTFFENVKKILLDILQRHASDAAINSELKDPRFQVSDLIQRIEDAKKPNVENAKKNLQRFPHLARMIGSDFEIARSSPSHPLIAWLSEANTSEQDPDKKQETGYGSPYAKLMNIEASLLRLQHESGMPSLRHDLLEKNQFYSVRAELGVAARLKSRHRVTLRPKVDGHYLDIKADINGSEVFFEIYRPWFQRCDYPSPTYGEKHLVWKKVREKIRDQIKYAIGFGLPVVLVIDNARVDICSSDIDDLFFGNMLEKIPNRCEIKLSDLEKEEKSIYYKAPEARVISAILLVNLDHDSADMPMKFKGDLFPAPHPLLGLDCKTAKSIKKALFEDSSDPHPC